MAKLKTTKNNRILTYFQNGFIVIISLWFIAGAVYFYDLYQDRKLVFITKNPIEFFQTSDLNKDTKIGIINPGDPIKVLRVLFIDNHTVIHLQTNTGLQGFVLQNEDIKLKTSKD